MTALLDAPALDVTLLEARQPHVPLICTRGHSVDDEHPPCPRAARWEAFCTGCGHVFRRCAPCYADDCDVAADWHPSGGAEWQNVAHLCVCCDTKVYIQQYGRL